MFIERDIDKYIIIKKNERTPENIIEKVNTIKTEIEETKEPLDDILVSMKDALFDNLTNKYTEKYILLYKIYEHKITYLDQETTKINFKFNGDENNTEESSGFCKVFDNDFFKKLTQTASVNSLGPKLNDKYTDWVPDDKHTIYKIDDFYEIIDSEGTNEEDMNINIRKTYPTISNKSQKKSPKLVKVVSESLTKKERKKRKELSVSATKTLNKHNVNVVVAFD